MFRKSEHRKRSTFLPFVLFRLLLSVVMFLILGTVFYQAFLSFSGISTSPSVEIKKIITNPQGYLTSLLSIEKVTETASVLLGIRFDGSELLGKKVEQSEKPTNSSINSLGEAKQNSAVVIKFAVVADSHNDNENLGKALSMAKDKGAKFVIGLGDYTATGTVNELKKAREVFEDSKLPFYLTAGDHDLWDARDKGKASVGNFNQIFGPAYQTFSDSGIRFVILFNSDNYQGVDSSQMDWLESILVQDDDQEKVLVFLHEPLYHPSSDRVMGKTNAEVAKQAKVLTNFFKGVQALEIFAADVHAFGRYSEPASSLKMTTVGAVTRERNTQAPRFVMVDIYEGGSYNIEDLEIR